MGAKQSSNNGRTQNGTSDPSRNVENGAAVLTGEVGHSRVVTLEPRIRTRSLNNVGRVLTIPGHSASFRESDLSSSPEDGSPVGRSGLQVAHSFPSHLFASSFLHGLKCPVCSKFVQSDDLEIHLVMCLTKPRISYNEDVLTQEAGECVICLEDLAVGEKIARLPCLCIYHKKCIDDWFQVNRSCPEHPS